MKLYIKQSILDKDDIKSLIDQEGTMKQAGIVRGKEATIDTRSRSTSIKQLHAKDFPTINQKIMKLLGVFNPDLDLNKFYVKEYNYLIYNVGDHFEWHRDDIQNEKRPTEIRRYSTSTILDLSDDLEGGEFGISDGAYSPIVSLGLGETLLFDSTTKHKVYPVTKGKRVVLVAWIYDK